MFSPSITDTQSRFAPRKNLPSAIVSDRIWLRTIFFGSLLCETSASLRYLFFLFLSPCRAFPAKWMEVK
jgi:hypothetical protein